MNLSEIQQQLKAPKSHTNTFGNYKYRNCEDILEAVKPLLGESRLVLSDDIVLIGERYYVKAFATFTNGQETVIATAYAREPLEKKGSDASQITGAASSYARKYALNGLFLIDDTKDADHDGNETSAPAKPEPKKMTKSDEMKVQIARALKELGEEATPPNILFLTGMEAKPDNYAGILDRLAALKDERASK